MPAGRRLLMAALALLLALLAVGTSAGAFGVTEAAAGAGPGVEVVAVDAGQP